MSSAHAFLRRTLAQLHCACEAMGISPDDIDLNQFSTHDRARWRHRATADLCRFINDEPGSCVPSQRQVARVHTSLTGRHPVGLPTKGKRPIPLRLVPKRRHA